MKFNTHTHTQACMLSVFANFHSSEVSEQALDEIPLGLGKVVEDI